MSEETINKKIYELGYHVLPNLSEEELAKVVEALKSKITELGGDFIADQYPSTMPLAYSLVKEIDNKSRAFDSAYFGWLKFELDSAKLEDLKTALDKNANMLRYLLIKTVRESTLASIKLSTKSHHKRFTSEPKQDSAPMNTEEVDKKIEEMVDEDSATEDLN